MPGVVGAFVAAHGQGHGMDRFCQKKVTGWNRCGHSKVLVRVTEDGEEALGSMGNDTPLACLSEQNRPVFDFFYQLFAQARLPQSHVHVCV